MLIVFPWILGSKILGPGKAYAIDKLKEELEAVKEDKEIINLKKNLKNQRDKLNSN